jgi:hypothetical protein
VWSLLEWLRTIEDLHAMLNAEGDWMPLRARADEQKPAADGTFEASGARALDSQFGPQHTGQRGDIATPSRSPGDYSR